MSFSAALECLHVSIVTGDPAPAMSLLRPHPRLDPAQQLTIYSNAYRSRLRQAVQADYPCFAVYLGEPATQKLIDAYVEAVLPKSYNLDSYPFGFALFVRTHHAQTAAAELAELEGAITEVFMGQGTQPLTLDNLPHDPEQLGETKFALRQPSRLLRFTYDVESAMTAFKRGEVLGAMPQHDVCMFIHRHHNEVQRRILDADEYQLLTALHEAPNFDAAIRQAMAATNSHEDTMAQNIARWLPRWVKDGFLALT